MKRHDAVALIKKYLGEDHIVVFKRGRISYAHLGENKTSLSAGYVLHEIAHHLDYRNRRSRQSVLQDLLRVV